MDSITVSNLIVDVSLHVARNSTAQADLESWITYVSLPAGSYPTGAIASIRNRRMNEFVTAAMMDGGLDPVAISAAEGDTIITTIEKVGDAPEELFNVVPSRRRPRVVRTVPARRKTDVPLNARMTIVFSEPIDRATLTVSSVRVVSGSATVAGQVILSDSSGLVAEFVPAGTLAANSPHELRLSQDIRDLDGDPLEAPTIVEFTTGDAVAVASIVTDQAALFTTSGGTLRTLTMTAVLQSDGRFSGNFSVYFSDTKKSFAGSVICFGLLDGKAAWIAGRSEFVDNEPAPSTMDFGWRLTDNDTIVNGVVQPGVKDQLSLAYSLEPDIPVSAQDFCATTPVTDPRFGEMRLFNLESGNFVVSGTMPPPEPVPPSTGMSQIAYRTSAYNIHIMNADGTNVRAFTAGGGDTDPAWSPDGQRLAFVRSDHAQGNYGSIHVMNADRTGLKQLTTSINDKNPDWSPDGTRIAFARAGIYVMNAADGSGLARLTPSEWGASDPTWSPDGTRIAFARTNGSTSTIWVMNSDGTGTRQVTSDSLNAYSPAWSPDGSKIAFVRVVCEASYSCAKTSISVMNSDGTGLRRLTISGRDPSWSPDGNQIVFEDFGINVINVDGSGRTKRGNGLLPAWSRSGTTPPLPPAFLSIEAAGGNEQTDTVRATLAQPLSVRVVRDDGSPAAGVRVDWLFPGAGQDPSPRLSTYITTTDASGLTSVTMTLGAFARRHTLHAAIIDGSARSDGVEFVVTARPGTPTTFWRASWDTVFAIVDSTVEFAANARDSHGPCLSCGNYVTGVPISWELTAGAGSLAPSMDTTGFTRPDYYGSVPVSRTLLTVGPSEGTRTVMATAATMAGAPQLAFTALAVTKIVSVNSGTFDADSVEVPSGRTVAWIWWPSGDSDDVHNVTFEDDPTQPVSSPTRYYGWHQRTFAGLPRAIRYRCSLHTESFSTGEVGVVVVR